MSAVLRQVIWSSLFVFFIVITILVGMFIAIPDLIWQDLWNEELMDIPVGVFIPAFSIAVAIVFGLVSGFYWRNQFAAIDKAVHSLEEGRQLEFKADANFSEVQSIQRRISKIYKQMTEQTILSQRLATEKVEDIEGRIQEIISQERNRLARELHDSVSQQLFAASMMMSAITEPLSEKEDRQSKQLKMVEEMIHQSQLEMRALLLHLRPVALKDKTLQEGIEELLIELSQKVTMNIHWKVEAFPLDKGLEDHLFRILQESVSNTLRHSKATKLEVLLIKRDDLIILRVADDGIGFEDGSKAGSYGLQNMHERALEVGGTLKVVSLKDKGTRLEVKVPMILNEGAAND
ncbi:MULTISPECIES: sensor histidine kinase [unclassified Bacillus (in: firmicutes)]|uniref:sensor histidine kinase n=1 Tax=unclassified Bacillus (in: firmicutes) TaxID=185979 RepID=UPI0008F16873|nr:MULTISPECIES: sensor histidine kinase [unclassified Bacillus (in: firmicutes)]SFB08335.1 two-component system, NarL family, sensor histidine kinase LiaS [Bacillus sp. UNCCL13]SFQ87105.1 two-component system, NarL family, sensor histidine kinase LiaS [Bacillus sp. cl95]